MKLIFSKIHKDEIFNKDFDNLSEGNGTIEFKKKYTSGGIAVVYAPNGTGKSSLTEVLKIKKASDNVCFYATDELGNNITPENNKFHIVEDQISRHIIEGDESQYLVGAQIKKEFELKKRINEGFVEVFKEKLPKLYKSKYSVSKKGDYLIEKTKEVSTEGCEFIKNIVNRNTHGSNISRDDFILYLSNNENKLEVSNLDQKKTEFVIRDCAKSKVVERLLTVKPNSVIKSSQAPLIEQHDDAIRILDKYQAAKSCIVCDNEDYDGQVLLAQKKASKQRIYDSLDQVTKDLLDKVVMDSSLANEDPFDIKEIVLRFISESDLDGLTNLQEDLKNYIENIVKNMLNDLYSCFDGTNVVKDYDELSKLQKEQPRLDDDDLLFIQDVISENIDRDIKIIRADDSERNFKLMLGDLPLLNVEREQMCLSTGEQNFISLAFELLLAKNSSKEYIVIDDPISSFDSVYKNKIAFCIVKFLEKKKQIVLTHNLELVKLLEFQLKDCFNLYMLNNNDGGRNGFIRVQPNEQELLINFHKLIALFQNKNGKLMGEIKNRRLFLISMIPFMRGYAHFTLDLKDYYGRLSEIMHGYGTAEVDLIPVYNELFGVKFSGKEKVTSKDVLEIDCDELDFFSKDTYPLLAETLRQTLVYYYLRMTVEKTLIDVFKIPIKPNKIMMLNDIIQSAFKASPNDDDFKIKRSYRVFFASRKTLLNEFNHFEGNVNIFQPAIDITESKLEKEIRDIKDKLEKVKLDFMDVNR